MKTVKRTAAAAMVPVIFHLLVALCLPSFTVSQYYNQTPAAPHIPPPPPQQTADNNPRLQKAYIALQAWKKAIVSDPKGITNNWCGPNVCGYEGVFCAPAPDDSCLLTVAGIDINHGDIAGHLPEELGLLSDLALFHLNSNHFCGQLPSSFSNFHLLFELDVSNNHFYGPFPSQVLCLPSLKYLDLRFNQFSGDIPSSLFEHKNLDAIFLNNNNFQLSKLNFTGSQASVIVLANNHLDGCVLQTLPQMSQTITELVLLNSNISSCIPPDIGKLRQLVLLDLSFNNLVGTLPESIKDMRELEVLNVGHNLLGGEIPEDICSLPHLKNFTYDHNFFCGEPHSCLMLPAKDDRQNCILNRPDQRSGEECISFFHRPPVHCDCHGCLVSPAPSSPPPPQHW